MHAKSILIVSNAKASLCVGEGAAMKNTIAVIASASSKFSPMDSVFLFCFCNCTIEFFVGARNFLILKMFF